MKKIAFRFIRFALLFAMSVFADDSNLLEVSALNFSADEKSGIIELEGEVAIKKGKDELFAPKVVINIDKNRTPLRYFAFGGVDFAVTTNDNRLLKGRADEVSYDPKIGEYRLKGNAKVNERDKINSVVGDEIVINNDIGFVNITGKSGKPAKLIFQMKDSQKKAQDSRENRGESSGESSGDLGKSGESSGDSNESSGNFGESKGGSE